MYTREPPHTLALLICGQSAVGERTMRNAIVLRWLDLEAPAVTSGVGVVAPSEGMGGGFDNRSNPGHSLLTSIKYLIHI